MELHPDQEKAVKTTKGPVVIVAGPGSGKTFVIVERIAHLISEKDIAPENILAVTFTTKAAHGLRERLKKRIGSSLPTVATFHALAFDILKSNAPAAGLNPAFSIISESEHEQSDGKNRIDYDDLLLYTKNLFLEHPEVLSRYQRQFEYIMVDEYQDTSEPQAELLDFLARHHKNLCIIGDPDQAIYGFRGASRKNFLTFTARYPSAAGITLSHNYRSTPEILGVAHSILPPSEIRAHTTATRPSGHRVVRMGTPDAKAEAAYIARTIHSLIGGGDFLSLDSRYQTASDETYHFGDIAIIYRLHAIGKDLARALEKANIPYIFFGAKNFFEHPEIRNVLNHLKKKTPTTKLSDELRTLYADLELEKQYDNRSPKGTEQWNRLLQLLTIAATYDHLEPQNAQEVFFAGVTTAHPEDDELQPNTVTLLSAHAAKGLEFPVVFVAGAEDGLFPYIRAAEDQDNSDHLAEENRLLYVALTRAKDKLYISHASHRTLFGKTLEGTPSRFLNAIPSESMEHTILNTKPKKQPSPQQPLF